MHTFAISVVVKQREGVIVLLFFTIVLFKIQVYVGFPSFVSAILGQYINELRSSLALQKKLHAPHGNPWISLSPGTIPVPPRIFDPFTITSPVT